MSLPRWPNEKNEWQQLPHALVVVFTCAIQVLIVAAVLALTGAIVMTLLASVT